jgi:hypothetical protein
MASRRRDGRALLPGGRDVEVIGKPFVGCLGLYSIDWSMEYNWFQLDTTGVILHMPECGV